MEDAPAPLTAGCGASTGDSSSSRANSRCNCRPRRGSSSSGTTRPFEVSDTSPCSSETTTITASVDSVMPSAARYAPALKRAPEFALEHDRDRDHQPRHGVAQYPAQHLEIQHAAEQEGRDQQHPGPSQHGHRRGAANQQQQPVDRERDDDDIDQRSGAEARQHVAHAVRYLGHRCRLSRRCGATRRQRAARSACAHAPPSTRASTACCVCMRFSTWSNTAERGDSIMSSVISWPR